MNSAKLSMMPGSSSLEESGQGSLPARLSGSVNFNERSVTGLSRPVDFTAKSESHSSLGRAAYTLIPLTATVLFYGGICLALVAQSGRAGFGRFGMILAGDWFYVIPGTGKILAVPLMVSKSIHPTLAAASTIFMDCVVSFAVAFNFNQLCRLPMFGSLVRRLMDRSENLLKRRRFLRRFSFAGLVCVVAIPVEGAGGVGGTILGLMMGLGPARAWGAVFIGASLRSFCLAYGADFARRFLARYDIAGFVALILCLGIIGLSLYRGHRKKAGRSPAPDPARTSLRSQSTKFSRLRLGAPQGRWRT